MLDDNDAIPVFGPEVPAYGLDDRMGFQEAFYTLTRRLGDEMGYGVHFENDTFEMHPYCWCESDDCPQCGTHTQVNFWHKPTDLKVVWYKYPMRAAELNQPLTLEAFTAVVDACVASLDPAVPSTAVPSTT